MRLGRPTNPVLDRELKERLRTRRATIVVTVYLGILSLILYAVYQAQASSGLSNFNGGPIASQAASFGRTLFETIVLVMLGLVLFIVPGLTADALTGERERQTLVPLQVTLLRPRAIVVGKLLASLAFVTLLVVATLPLVGISFILGGVAVGQVVKAVVAVLATGVVVASLALACSSIARRTQGAMVLSYGVALFLTIGAPMIFLGQRATDDAGSLPSPTVLLLSPFAASADFVAPPEGNFNGFDGGSTSPLRAISRGLRDIESMTRGGFVEFQDDRVAVATTMVILGDDEAGFAEEGPAVAAEEPGDEGLSRFPFWVRSTVVLGGLALVGLVVATRRITTPSDRSAS